MWAVQRVEARHGVLRRSVLAHLTTCIPWKKDFVRLIPALELNLLGQRRDPNLAAKRLGRLEPS